MAHTPGPWRVDDTGARIVSEPPPLVYIGVAYAPVWSPAPLAETDPKTTEWEANARLMAAAPDMLAALRRVERWLHDPAELEAVNELELLAVVRAAIAKAEGR